MGWREKMGTKNGNINSTSYPQKEQKEQKGYHEQAFATFAAFAPKDRNEKQIIPPPDPAGLGPEYNDLWAKAWTLADWIDDNNGGIDIEQRRARMPELIRMRDELSRLEKAGARADS